MLLMSSNQFSTLVVGGGRGRKKGVKGKAAAAAAAASAAAASAAAADAGMDGAGGGEAAAAAAQSAKDKEQEEVRVRLLCYLQRHTLPLNGAFSACLACKCAEACSALPYPAPAVLECPFPTLSGPATAP